MLHVLRFQGLNLFKSVCAFKILCRHFSQSGLFKIVSHPKYFSKNLLDKKQIKVRALYMYMVNTYVYIYVYPVGDTCKICTPPCKIINTWYVI